MREFEIVTHFTNVLKTGLDRAVRPVGLSTGDLFGSVPSFGLTINWTSVELLEPIVEPSNCLGRAILGELNDSTPPAFFD